MAKDNALAGATLSATFATLRALGFLFIAWGTVSRRAAARGQGMSVHFSLRVRHVKLERVSGAAPLKRNREQEYKPSSSGSHTGRGRQQWGTPGGCELKNLEIVAGRARHLTAAEFCWAPLLRFPFLSLKYQHHKNYGTFPGFLGLGYRY